MIGYHWSPRENRDSIAKHGLLVPSRHPKLTMPVTCSEDCRNPHISLGREPYSAWLLSGGFVIARSSRSPFANIPHCPLYWDLYEVFLPRHSYRAHGDELKSRKDIRKANIRLVATRSWDL